jgi:magnesium transporter
MNTEQLETTDKFEPDTWINVIEPTEAEIVVLEEKLGLDHSTIKQILSEEEISRIELENNRILTLIDVPIIEKKSHHFSFNTCPFGIIIIDDKYIVTMCSKEIEFLNRFKTNSIRGFHTAKKNRFTLQILSAIAREYLKNLKVVNEETERAEKFIGKATENKELLRLLSIDKSLVYLTTSLKANEVVFERLLNANILTIYEEDKDIIEEAIIKNKQAIELAQIYKDILNGLTTSFATISSNNLNHIMKFLAGMTIVLSIPTMIASFMGMNVKLTIFDRSEYSFFFILGVAFIIAFLVAKILKRKNML